MATPDTLYAPDLNPALFRFLKTSDGKFVKTQDGKFILTSEGGTIYTTDTTPATVFTTD